MLPGGMYVTTMLTREKVRCNFLDNNDSQSLGCSVLTILCVGCLPLRSSKHLVKVGLISDFDLLLVNFLHPLPKLTLKHVKGLKYISGGN